jgi:hypothetical protein
VFFTKKKKRTVENESWFYHIFRKNSVLVHAKTSTSYDTVENALTLTLELRWHTVGHFAKKIYDHSKHT